MGELLKSVEQIFPLLKLIALVFAALAGLLALGIVTYILHTTGKPLFRVLSWLCWYEPGKPPHPALAGVSHGARLVLWAGFLGLSLVFLIHLLRG
jgi:hypothetical protein